LLIPTAYAGSIGAPYAPTRRKIVRKAFKELELGSEDTLVDLGVGDGSILLDAQARGATALGFELSPIMWAVAKIRTMGKKRISLHYGNFYKQKFPEATVLFAFLMPDNMARVKKFLSQQSMPRGKFFLSYAFPFKDEPPLTIIRAKKCSPIYVYDLQQLTKGVSESTKQQ